MSRVAMCEVRSKEKTIKNKPKKKKYNGQQQKEKDSDKPIWCRIKKRSPSSGQNNQLVHWWLLVYSGPLAGPRNRQDLETVTMWLCTLSGNLHYGPPSQQENFLWNWLVYYWQGPLELASGRSSTDSWAVRNNMHLHNLVQQSQMQALWVVGLLVLFNNLANCTNKLCTNYLAWNYLASAW